MAAIVLNQNLKALSQVEKGLSKNIT